MYKKKIVMGGEYESKGRPARILAVDIQGNLPVVAAVLSNGSELILGFDEYGTYGGIGCINEHNLVPSYRNFKIDEPVMSRVFEGDTFVKRHFAGVDEYGNPIVFANGCTSWSSHNTITVTECRRPTAEELAGTNT